MKTLCLIFVSFFVYFNSFSVVVNIDSLEKRLKTVEVQLKMLKQEPEGEGEFSVEFLGEPTKEFIEKQKICKFRHNKCCPSRASSYHLSFLQKLYVLSPILLVLLVLFLLFISLKKIDYSIKNSLSDFNQEKEVYVPSFVKLITFISVLVAVIIVAVILSVYMYYIFSGRVVPRFVGLWPVVAIIGLSFLPYIIKEFFNK
ncbi:MAG: hypothetical protein N3A01_05010 [Bacteroidales bacterium]|nr:hypothetical protein [Bacteroidales bacterium]